MKTLLFLRHAKSDWDAAWDDDHERPLAKRGRKAAKVMGRLLADIGEVPDSIICSTAVRARQTLERAAKAGAWQAPVRTTDVLYGVTPAAVLGEVHQEPDTTETLMLVGHEPAWSETIASFIGGGDIRFPTAAAARIDFDVASWQDVAFARGQLIWLLPPRLLT